MTRFLAFVQTHISMTGSIGVGYAIVALLSLLALKAFAATTDQTQLLDAIRLVNQGKFVPASQLLDSLVHTNPSVLNDTDRGMAWNTLGAMHMLMGDSERSRECYENAIRLLRKIPAASRAYASALANLASLEMSMHQYEEAESPLRKAQQIDAEAADHAGLQEVALYRTELAIARNRTHAAQRFLADAFREADQTKDLSLRNRATMYSAAGSVAVKLKDFSTAVRYYQQSIDFSIQACGSRCFYTGLEYAFQAEAYRKLGDHEKARIAITQALALTEQAVGRSGPVYIGMKVIYARILRGMGLKAEAKQQEADARQQLDAMRQSQCNGCSISASGFR